MRLSCLLQNVGLGDTKYVILEERKIKFDLMRSDQIVNLTFDATVKKNMFGLKSTFGPSQSSMTLKDSCSRPQLIGIWDKGLAWLGLAWPNC